jgi:hypothetical protein
VLATLLLSPLSLKAVFLNHNFPPWLWLIAETSAFDAPV